MAYSAVINNQPTTVSFSIDSFFDRTYIEPNKSPIDNYFEKTDDLNKLFTYHDIAISLVPPTSVFPNQTLHNLILLGYVSIVESYFRELIRKVVLVDKYSSKQCEKHNLKYGAAILHSRELLPEALLEGYSFASQENIANSLKDFLDLKNIYNNPSLKDAAEKFQDICQLRHILVHRYGKLGIDNFIKLRNHSLGECIEKPLELNSAKLYNISIVCNNLVLVFNQYISNNILDRTAKTSAGIWHWDYRKDKVNFMKYFNIFECSSNPPSNGKPDAKTIYDSLREYGRTLI